jgi:hypothetical protein
MNDELYIAEWNHSKWLVLSSGFFVIPSVYSYYIEFYGFSILLLLTSLVSANYWRKATYSWRRTTDLVFAKISFTIFVSNGLIYVRNIPYIITGYSGLVLLIYCYYLSDTLSKMKNEDWFKYHMLFHLIMTYEQLIIIDSIRRIQT